jgi:hypothetical protein
LKEQIEKFEGEYDEDNFYRLKEGGFYDESGFYFNKEGIDALGGHYNEDGIYVEGQGKKNDKEVVRAGDTHALEIEEIELLDGEFDEQGFFQLDEGGFYDPHGFYFDADGFDEVGGYYDEYDNYVDPQYKDEVDEFEYDEGEEEHEL